MSQLLDKARVVLEVRLAPGPGSDSSRTPSRARSRVAGGGVEVLQQVDVRVLGRVGSPELVKHEAPDGEGTPWVGRAHRRGWGPFRWYEDRTSDVSRTLEDGTILKLDV